MSKTVTRTAAFVAALLGVFFLRLWSADHTNKWVEQAREESRPTFPVATYPTLYSPPIVLPPIDTGKKMSPEEKQKFDERINELKARRTNPPPRRS
jgi:hypothetical protein